jgi:hypothetical protein
VAVHVGSPVKPVTVKDAGVASVALADAGDAVPLAQERETVTDAPLLSEKSLLTVKAAVFRVLMIVQVAAPPSVIAMPAQPAWLAV